MLFDFVLVFFACFVWLGRGESSLPFYLCLPACLIISIWPSISLLGPSTAAMWCVWCFTQGVYTHTCPQTHEFVRSNLVGIHYIICPTLFNLPFLFLLLIACLLVGFMLIACMLAYLFACLFASLLAGLFACLFVWCRHAFEVYIKCKTTTGGTICRMSLTPRSLC